MAQKRENIHKYLFGHPFRTDSVVADIPVSAGEAPYLLRSQDETGEVFRYALSEEDRVYGLGEQGARHRQAGLGICELEHGRSGNPREQAEPVRFAQFFSSWTARRSSACSSTAPARSCTTSDYTTRGEMAIFCGRDFRAVHHRRGERPRRDPHLPQDDRAQLYPAQIRLRLRAVPLGIHERDGRPRGRPTSTGNAVFPSI